MQVLICESKKHSTVSHIAVSRNGMIVALCQEHARYPWPYACSKVMGGEWRVADVANDTLGICSRCQRAANPRTPRPRHEQHESAAERRVRTEREKLDRWNDAMRGLRTQTGE
jgi:hypothetical protein